MPKLPAVIFSADRVIVAVSKEVLIPVGLVGRSGHHRSRVRIDKPSPGRVIIPAAEVVQARLGVIDIPAIAERIVLSDIVHMGAVMIQHIAPCVVDISHNRVPVAVHDLNHIALRILDVQICGPVVRHGRRANGVVGEVHPVAAPGQVRQGVAQIGVIIRRPVDRLGNALAIGIVAIGDAAAALAHGRQLAAVLPGIGPRAVVQGVAYGVVGDGLPIERRQQVRPISVAAAAPGEDEAPPGTSFRD